MATELDGIGFFGNLFECAMVIALGGSALLVFLYLWRKGRLDMDQEPAIAMMQSDDDEPAIFIISSEIGRLRSVSIENRSSEIADAIPSSRFSIAAAPRSVDSCNEIMKIADEPVN